MIRRRQLEPDARAFDSPWAIPARSVHAFGLNSKQGRTVAARGAVHQPFILGQTAITSSPPSMT